MKKKKHQTGVTVEGRCASFLETFGHRNKLMNTIIMGKYDSMVATKKNKSRLQYDPK